MINDGKFEIRLMKKDLKDFKKIAEDMGTSASSLLRMYIKQIINEKQGIK